MKEGIRIRENGSITRIGGSFTYTNSGVIQSSSSYLSGFTGETMWMRDYVTPDFRERQSSGRFVNNGMRKVTERRSDSGGGSAHSHLLGAGPQREVYTFSMLFPQRQSGAASAKALFTDKEIEMMKIEVGTRAMAGVESSTAEGLVTLAELTKTLKTLKRPFENIEGLVKDIAKSNAYRKYHAMHFTRSLGSFLEKEWLRLRYGFRPMMHDIQNINDAAWNLMTTEKVKTRATSRSSSSYSRSENHSSTHADSTFTGPVSGVYEDLIKVRAGVLYDRQFTDKQNFANREFGLRLDDLPGLAWEITPWSFIYDWAFNCGQFISAWTPRYGVTRQVEWTSVQRIRKHVKNIGPLNLNATVLANGWVLDSAPATGQSLHEILEYERFPSLNTGITYKVDSLPKIGNDVKKMFDLFALFSQNLRK